MGTGFDRNTVIGWVLIIALLLGYIFIAQREQSKLQQQKQHIQDSLARIQPPSTNPVTAKSDSVHQDSLRRTVTAGAFSSGVQGQDQTAVLENDLVRITFTNRGGQPEQVELKKFKRFDGTPLYLVAKNDQEFSYKLLTGPKNAADSKDLYFTASGVTQRGTSQVLSYTLKDSLGRSVEHEYVLDTGQYMLQMNIRINGALELLPGSTLNASWSFTALPQERDVTYEKRTTSLSYFNADGYDYKTLSSTGGKDLAGLTWVGTKQRFFNNTLISKDNQMGASLHWTAFPDSTHDLVSTDMAITIKLPASESVTLPLQWYMGPNDYKILKAYGMHLEENVQMGNGIYAFTKYLNRWIVIPIFNFFHSFVANFGIVILLLTFFIRLVISPLTYSSYLSGAKMRVLRPEIDELKKKYKDDQQTFGVEQMKLFRAAGVNPLGGCIPAILQIPIFFALYSFFNSSLALRGQHFLWSHDLSTFDSIYNFSFSIPLYGNHVSLFTLTAIVSSFLIQIWNMNMTPDQNNPMMKYMPYIFPVVLLGVFNSLPSGLTWYYTVSNVVTLLIQLFIQKFVLDEKKIHAQLQENKKKPKTKSKWAERLEQIQETQKKAQVAKDKPQKR